MATVTPNYSWPVPTSTDLVKDGATAIEALGDAIDATVFALPSAGLTLINTTSFSAVASQSLNNVFSTDYENYRVVVNNLVGNTGTGHSLTLRFRVSNTDTTTGYYWQRIRGSGTSTTSSSANIVGEINLGVYNSGNRSQMVFDVTSPFLTVNTLITNNAADFDNNVQTQVSAGGLNDATSYTGLTIIGSSATMSGRISVFGYKK
jgi:hypothetical protein